MNDDVYRKLATVLDTLPNGFPATEDGLEIRILKKIFTPEQADLFCDLRLSWETAQQIADRTGRSLEGLDDQLAAMWRDGQVFGVDFGTTRVYKMLPWAFGIYEFQLPRMDQALARMCDAYHDTFAPQFFKNKPQLMQVVPIEAGIEGGQETMPYEKVSAIIERGQSFGLAECICKKEQRLVGKGCDAPLEVCLGIAPVPGIFDDSNWGRPISKEEAYAVLDQAEKAGLVHLTSNVKEGHFYICNCCGCCCGVLRSMNKWGIHDGTNSHYVARIDAEACIGCGLCADERCQVEAIREADDVFQVIREKCIGCGLCVTTCPEEAIALVRKPAEEIVAPPENETLWFRERGRLRGVDFSQYE